VLGLRWRVPMTSACAAFAMSRAMFSGPRWVAVVVMGVPFRRGGGWRAPARSGSGVVGRVQRRGAVVLGVVLGSYQVVLDQLGDLAVAESGDRGLEVLPGSLGGVVLGVADELAAVGDDADGGGGVLVHGVLLLAVGMP